MDRLPPISFNLISHLFDSLFMPIFLMWTSPITDTYMHKHLKAPPPKKKKKQRIITTIHCTCTSDMVTETVSGWTESRTHCSTLVVKRWGSSARSQLSFLEHLQGTDTINQWMNQELEMHTSFSIMGQRGNWIPHLLPTCETQPQVPHTAVQISGCLECRLHWTSDVLHSM